MVNITIWMGKKTKNTWNDQAPSTQNGKPLIHSSSKTLMYLMSWHWSRCVSYKRSVSVAILRWGLQTLAWLLPMLFLRNLESTASMAMYPRRNIFLCMSSLHTMAPTQSFSTIACDTSQKDSHQDTAITLVGCKLWAKQWQISLLLGSICDNYTTLTLLCS